MSVFLQAVWSADVSDVSVLCGAAIVLGGLIRALVSYSSTLYPLTKCESAVLKASLSL